MIKKKRVWITKADSRDDGKLFLLTEKPALQAEMWAHRALGAITMVDTSIPEEIRKGGMAGLASIGFESLAKINLDYYQMLMDEMLECVQIVDNKVPRAIAGEDIEEVTTLMALRTEVFALHTGFSIAGVH